MFDLKTSILIADDSLMMRKLISTTCKKLGFTILQEAENGALALEILHSAQPPIGLVICDWRMPVLTGIEFLKKVRSLEQYKSLPFLMITAEAENQQIVEAIHAGVSNYIVKPFSHEILATKLEEMSTKSSYR